MAYWVTHTHCGNNSMMRYFQCDYKSDIENLPTATKTGVKQENDTVSSNYCASGSRCLCHENGAVYVLGKATDSWIKIGNAGAGTSIGGGTTSAEENIEPISYDEIDNMFEGL